MVRVCRQSLKEAWKEVENAKDFLRKEDYKGAKTCMTLAVQLAPTVEDGLELSILTETLYYGHNLIPNLGIDWYSILHLHPSASLSEIETQFHNLKKHASPLPTIRSAGFKTVMALLEQAACVLLCNYQRLGFDEKRKQCGIVDSPVECTRPFKEMYWAWKPPALVFTMEKRAKTDTPSLARSVKKSKVLTTQVFDEMPQHPHYAPLENYSLEVREEMILRLENDFVKLVGEIQVLDQFKTFCEKENGFAKKLEELEEMGYNVDKPRERLESLQSIVDRVQDLDVKVIEKKSKIVHLENAIKDQVSKIGNIKKHSNNALKEFVSIAKRKWK